MNSFQIFIKIRRPNIIGLRQASTSTAEYCMNLVKSYDYENFVSSLLLKNHTRSCAFAIRSFNVEISRIAEQVTDKNIGLMRMQFWEDTIEKCFLKDRSKVPEHPVAIELFKVISRQQLPKRHLKNLIASRKQLLSMSSFCDLEDIEKYAELSVSSIYYLILEGSGIKNVNADHAVSHLGKSQGIVQQIRTIPHCAKFKFVPLPQDILIKNNISHETLFRAKNSKALSDCVYEVASRAHQHLLKAKSLKDSIPKEVCPVLLPSIAISNYLEKLERVDYDVFHPQLQRRSWNLLFLMWIANFRNKY